MERGVELPKNDRSSQVPIRANVGGDQDAPGCLEGHFKLFPNDLRQAGRDEPKFWLHSTRVLEQCQDGFTQPTHGGDPHAGKIDCIQPGRSGVHMGPCSLEPGGTIGGAGKVG